MLFILLIFSQFLDDRMSFLIFLIDHLHLILLKTWVFSSFLLEATIQFHKGLENNMNSMKSYLELFPLRKF